MTRASLDLTDLPTAAIMIFGLALVMLGVMAYENWRLIRMRRRSGHHDAGLGDFPRYRPWQEISPRMRALRVTMFVCCAVAFIAGMPKAITAKSESAYVFIISSWMRISEIIRHR